MESKSKAAALYCLATGDIGADRLRLLDAIYGPAFYSLLLRLKLNETARMVDVGCGTGNTALWLGNTFTRAEITGVDVSTEQLTLARASAEMQGLHNVRFLVADACATTLATGVYDLVHCRALLCHLKDPMRALAEMRRLVKPGGILLCEDFDSNSVITEPPRGAYARAQELDTKLFRAMGLDADIGLRLPSMLARVCVASPQIQFFQPAFLSGEGKRLIEYTLAEQLPYIVETGVATREQMISLMDALRQVNEDDQVLVALWRMTQAWGYG